MKFSAQYLILLLLSFSLIGCVSSDDEAPDTIAPVITLVGSANISLSA